MDLLRENHGGTQEGGATSFFSDIYHFMFAGYYVVRFIVSRYDTYFTYEYCYHMDRLSWVIKRFKKFLIKHPNYYDQIDLGYKQLSLLKPSELEKYPKKTAGNQLYRMLVEQQDQGYKDLREYRKQKMPHEVLWIDGENSYWDLVSKRNMVMTASHDLVHVILDADSKLYGEALVADYQFKHLRVPGNWVNLHLSLISQFILLRWKDLGKIHKRRDQYNESWSYLGLSLDLILSSEVVDTKEKLRLNDS